MAENKTIYLPRMRTRPGFTHSYQSAHGTKVVTVDEKGPVRESRATRVVTTRGRTGDDEGK